MVPVGSRLCHGDEDEFAQVHTRVGERQFGGIDDEVINSDNIDVNLAVNISARIVAMVVCIYGTLDGLKSVQNVERITGRNECD